MSFLTHQPRLTRKGEKARLLRLQAQADALERRKARRAKVAADALVRKERAKVARANKAPRPPKLKKPRKIKDPRKRIVKKALVIRLRKPIHVKTVKKGPPVAYKRRRLRSEGWADGAESFPRWNYSTGGTPHLYTSHQAFQFPTRLSVIEDVVNNRGKFNPVHHFSIEGRLAKIPNARDGNTIYVNLQDWCWYVINLHNLEFLAWPWLPTVSAATLSDYSISAFNKFHDQVPAEVSVANFMYELKDMKGMIPKIEKSFSKTVANNFLGFSFGTAPFVGDIQKMISMSDAVDKRLKHLISVNGKTTDLTFERKTSYEEPFFFQRSLSDGLSQTVQTDIGGDRVEFKRQSAGVTVRIGARLTQDLRDLADANAKLKALIAGSGFNHPARVVWNAIPYSFVVDWLFSAGKLLDGIAVQPFGGKYDVTDIGYSIKREASYVATYKPTWPAVVDGNPTLGGLRVKSYDRYEGFPATSLFLTDLSLTPKQQVLATAMLEQKRR